MGKWGSGSLQVRMQAAQATAQSVEKFLQKEKSLKQKLPQPSALPLLGNDPDSQERLSNHTCYCMTQDTGIGTT